jgi:hypothetical protein
LKFERAWVYYYYLSEFSWKIPLYVALPTILRNTNWQILVPGHNRRG